MRLIDGFTFNNELDVLEIRLNEMYNYVDQFILVEATKTHAGAPKPLWFAENKERFRPFLDKIRHVIVDDMPEGPNAWLRENHQRNAIIRGMADVGLDDIIIISDVDEIIRAEVLVDMREDPRLYSVIRMPIFYIKYNYMNIAGELMDVWPVGVHSTVFTTPQNVRNLREKLSKYQPDKAINGMAIYSNAGWHFSYIGDREHVIQKISDFAHQEFNTNPLKDSIDIDGILASGADLLGRPGYKWTAVAFDLYFPKFLRQNYQRFAPNIVGEPL